MIKLIETKKKGRIQSLLSFGNIVSGSHFRIFPLFAEGGFRFSVPSGFLKGFPYGPAVRNLPVNSRPGFIPGLVKIPWRKE